VITLGITRNKMPRWLSEGISVYEERQANPAWGQSMTPKYREMILNGELTPVANLSAAFLTAKTPGHVQFAYYESSLVVEYLVQKFGHEALKKILQDLGFKNFAQITLLLNSNEEIGSPVLASRQNNLARLLRKIRSWSPSRHAATPRCTNPVPFGGCPARYACGSYAHSSRPVFASRAITRLYDVLRNSVSPIMSGVAWKFPGRARGSVFAVSPVAHSHAGASFATFPRLMSVSVENFVAARSPPYTGHSLPACAFALVVAIDSAPATSVRVQQRVFMLSSEVRAPFHARIEVTARRT